MLIKSMKIYEKDATFHEIYVSPQLQCNVVQLVMEASMEKVMYNIFKPKARKIFILLDDMHFAERDSYGVIPVLDLLRQQTT